MTHQEFIFNAQVLGFDIPHVLNSNELIILEPRLLFTEYIKKYNPVLPENMIIDDYIMLDRTNISVLPDNLTVRGYLSLERCNNIQVLPKNLYINGNLYIRNTSIESIPKCTQVLGCISKDF